MQPPNSAIVNCVIFDVARTSRLDVNDGIWKRCQRGQHHPHPTPQQTALDGHCRPVA